MRKRYKHTKVVNQISKETGLDPKVVHLIIRKFYFGMRQIILKNGEINIKGFFKLKLSANSKKKIEKHGNEVNLRPRKNKKRYYVKKTKKKQ